MFLTPSSLWLCPRTPSPQQPTEPFHSKTSGASPPVSAWGCPSQTPTSERSSRKRSFTIHTVVCRRWVPISGSISISIVPQALSAKVSPVAPVNDCLSCALAGGVPNPSAPDIPGSNQLPPPLLDTVDNCRLGQQPFTHAGHEIESVHQFYRAPAF